jgi:hypothetical protein
MSRENPNVAQTVTGRLTGKRNYEPKLTLRIAELWGTNTVPDDLVVLEEQLSAMSSLAIEDGDSSRMPVHCKSPFSLMFAQ